MFKRLRMISSFFLFLSFLLLSLFLAACTATTVDEPETGSGSVEILVSGTVVPPTQTDELFMIELDDLGVAPEIKNDVWINADEPVTIASQRGKVILIEFWTFG
jgi:hypothetical protein